MENKNNYLIKRTHVHYKSKTFTTCGNTINCELIASVNLDNISAFRNIKGSELCDTIVNKLTKNNDCFVCFRMNEGWVIYFKSTGKASCSPEDTFNYEEGKKIALTRAQRNVFKKVKNAYEIIFREIQNNLNLQFIELIEGCANSYIKCHEHVTKLAE